MAKQATEIIDMGEFFFPGTEFALMFDWSTRHAKMPAHAFSVSKFGTKLGFQFTRPKV